MPSLEERVAYLEGRFGEHLQTNVALGNDIAVLRDDMNRRFNDLHGEMDRRFEQVDKRFEQVDRRFEQVDKRFDRADAKLDRHFTWLVGIQVASFLAMFGALVSRYFR